MNPTKKWFGSSFRVNLSKPVTNYQRTYFTTTVIQGPLCRRRGEESEYAAILCVIMLYCPHSQLGCWPPLLDSVYAFNYSEKSLFGSFYIHKKIRKRLNAVVYIGPRSTLLGTLLIGPRSTYIKRYAKGVPLSRSPWSAGPVIYW